MGSYLLKEFIEKDDNNVFLLVRGKTKKVAEDKAEKLLKDTFGDNYIAAKERVEAVWGDICEGDLIIEDKTRSHLIKKISIAGSVLESPTV